MSSDVLTPIQPDSLDEAIQAKENESCLAAEDAYQAFLQKQISRTLETHNISTETLGYLLNAIEFWCGTKENSSIEEFVRRMQMFFKKPQ